MGDEVHEYQGREPSGRKFGEICLDPKSKYLNTPKYTISTWIQQTGSMFQTVVIWND